MRNTMLMSFICSLAGVASAAECVTKDGKTSIKFDTSTLRPIESIEDGAEYNSAFGTMAKSGVTITQEDGTKKKFRADELYAFKTTEGIIEIGGLYDVSDGTFKNDLDFFYDTNANVGTLKYDDNVFIVSSCKF
jgi:hypothetical protein